MSMCLQNRAAKIDAGRRTKQMKHKTNACSIVSHFISISSFTSIFEDPLPKIKPG